MENVDDPDVVGRRDLPLEYVYVIRGTRHTASPTFKFLVMELLYLYLTVCPYFIFLERGMLASLRSTVTG